MDIEHEEWKLIEKELQHLHCPVKLIVDGFNITLVLMQYHTYKNVIWVCVNDSIANAWDLNDSETRRRFYCCTKLYAYSARIRRILKKDKKRMLKIMNIDLNAKYDVFRPYWTSFKALKAHLLKNNGRIEWINKPERTT